MTGSIEVGRDLIAEELLSRKVPEDRASRERIAGCLFRNFSDLLLPYLPKSGVQDASEQELNTQQQFVERIVRENMIWRSKHFLDAEILEGAEKVKVQIQLRPVSGVSLDAVSEFRISMPDSRVVNDTFVLVEKAAWAEGGHKSLSEDDYKTMMRLHTYLRAAKIVYRIEDPQVKEKPKI
jgi:hypothetical protein